MEKFNKWLVGGVVALAAMVVPSVQAAAQDWSAIGTAVTTEITAVAPVAMGIAGAIIAIVVGWKVFKRIAS